VANSSHRRRWTGRTESQARRRLKGGEGRGCLLNMPRKIGFEILIFPRRAFPPRAPLLVSFFPARAAYSSFLPPPAPCVPPSIRRRGSLPVFAFDGRSDVVPRKIPLARERSIPGLNTDVAIVRANGSDSLIILNFYVMYLLLLLLLLLLLSRRGKSFAFVPSLSATLSLFLSSERDLQGFQRVMEFPLATRR